MAYPIIVTKEEASHLFDCLPGQGMPNSDELESGKERLLNDEEIEVISQLQARGLVTSHWYEERDDFDGSYDGWVTTPKGVESLLLFIKGVFLNG